MPRRTVRSRARPSGEALARPGRNLAESPLEWLARRKDRSGAPLISQAQLKAGERLRADYTLAELMPRTTSDWSGMSGCTSRRGAPGMGVEMRDHAIAARERVARALKAVGPDFSGILLDVCCHLKGLEDLERRAAWPQRSAKLILGFALNALARHYGFDREGSQPQREARIRHWGEAGYRPPLEGESE